MSERASDETTRETGDDARTPAPARVDQDETAAGERRPAQPPGEKGGPKGPEPTRFGDWEKNGRCFDF